MLRTRLVWPEGSTTTSSPGAMRAGGDLAGEAAEVLVGPERHLHREAEVHQVAARCRR